MGIAAMSVLPSATCWIERVRVLPPWIWIVATFSAAATSARFFAETSLPPPGCAYSWVRVGIWA